MDDGISNVENNYAIGSSNAGRIVVILSAFLLQTSLGVIYTIGNLIPYILSYIQWKFEVPVKSLNIIWLQTLMCAPPLSMLMGGVIAKKFGARFGVLIGSIVYTSSIAVSYYTIQWSLSAFFITFGLIAGFGQGIASNCILIISKMWWPNKIGMITGIVIGGFACGAVILAPIQTMFINPNNYAASKDGVFTQIDLLERVPKVFLILASIYMTVQVICLLFLTVHDRVGVASTVDNAAAGVIFGPAELTMMETVLTPMFLLLFLTLASVQLCAQAVIGLYKLYGHRFIPSDMFLASIASFSSLSNCIGRICWGAIADRVSYQFSMLIICAVGSVLMFTIGIVRMIGSPTLYMIWVSTVFTCTGGSFTLIPFAIDRYFGSKKFGVLYGVSQFASFIGGVISSVLTEFVLPNSGFEKFFFIIGLFFIASFLLTCLTGAVQFQSNS